MSVALVDAGPIIALFDRADRAHAHYRAMLSRRSANNRLHTTWPCITEAAHFLSGAVKLEMLSWVGIGGVQDFPFEQQALLEMAPWMHAYTEPRRSEPCEMPRVSASITRTKGMMPLVLPLSPTGSPMPRTWPQ